MVYILVYCSTRPEPGRLRQTRRGKYVLPIVYVNNGLYISRLVVVTVLQLKWGCDVTLAELGCVWQL